MTARSAVAFTGGPSSSLTRLPGVQGVPCQRARMYNLQNFGHRSTSESTVQASAQSALVKTEYSILVTLGMISEDRIGKRPRRGGLGSKFMDALPPHDRFR